MKAFNFLRAALIAGITVVSIVVSLSFCALLFFSCEVMTPVDEVIFTRAEEFSAEREFLEQLFLQPDFKDKLKLRLIYENEKDEQEAAKKMQVSSPSLIIEFTPSWAQADGIPISKTWYVPKENPLAERIGTSFAACLAGKETLVPIEEIAPPYTGLLVDDLSAADENYPLVRYVSIRVRAAEDSGKNTRLQKKITALETKLAQEPKPLIQQTPSIVWICSAGDLMLDRGSGDILIDEGAAGILGKTADYFNKSD